MACYHPLDGYRSPSGAVKIGHEPQGSTEKLRVPCGSCFGCRMEYAEMWSVRCQHEAKLWDHNYFVTLTYDDEHLDWRRSLSVDHTQRFLKRLRKRISGDLPAPDNPDRRPIRYFLAGEYGTQTDRPHYHLLVFNADLEVRNQESEHIAETWPYGSHMVDRFTPGRARYIAGYAAKKVRGRIAREQHYSVLDPVTGEVQQRKPEFNTMSRNPGIGVWFFQRYYDDFMRGYLESEGGVRQRLPRYYKDTLMRNARFQEDEEERQIRYLENRDPREERPERLAAREAVHKARRGIYGRERGF